MAALAVARSSTRRRTPGEQDGPRRRGTSASGVLRSSAASPPGPPGSARRRSRGRRREAARAGPEGGRSPPRRVSGATREPGTSAGGARPRPGVPRTRGIGGARLWRGGKPRRATAVACGETCARRERTRRGNEASKQMKLGGGGEPGLRGPERTGTIGAGSRSAGRESELLPAGEPGHRARARASGKPLATRHRGPRPRSRWMTAGEQSGLERGARSL